MFRDLIGKGVEICNIGLQQGYIKEDGSVSTSGDTDHSKYVVTGFIDGGKDFLLYLNEHYFVAKVSVYDKDYNFLHQDIFDFSPRRYKHMQEFSYHLLENYKMRISIVHNETEPTGWSVVKYSVAPELDLTPDEDIISEFIYVDLNYFDKVPCSDPNYEDCIRRQEHLSNLRTDRGLYPCKESVDQGTSVEFGVLYSDQNETAGRVGVEVSPYTYITACHNPRSVMHTEFVAASNKGGISEYGITYYNTNTESRSWGYYGANCSNTVTYTLGWDTLPTAALFRPDATNVGRYPTTLITPEPDGSNLQIFDLLVSTAHIWVITNIWKDANGKVRFIETHESGGGNLTTAITMYSLETFLNRVQTEPSGGGYVIARMVASPTVENSEPVFDYVPNFITDTNYENVTYNDDICTFRGDKPAFMWGDKIFLNVQRNRGWDNVVIKKFNETSEQYEDFQNLDITYGATYPTKLLKGDWTDIDISSYYPYNGSEYGKYLAYCTASDGLNLFDVKTQIELKQTSTNRYYWMQESSSTIKLANSVGYECHLYAIPCKPNTTYIATTPSSTYCDTSMVKMAYGTMADLSFVETGTAMPVQSVVNSTVDNDKTTTVITTGSDATFLFIYLADPVAKAEKQKNTLVVKEKQNLFYPDYPVMQSQSGKSYWLDTTNYLVKIFTGTAFGPLYAIPCEPNTAYTAVIPSATTYDSTMLKLAWGTMSDLSFLQSNESALLSDYALGTVNANDDLVTTITTGDDATYLFVQLSDYTAKWTYAKNNLVLTADTKSDPTFYEVCALLCETDYINGVSTSIFKELKGNLMYQSYENGSGFCNREIKDTYRFYKPNETNRKNHCWSTETGIPSSSHTWSAFRVRGEYGVAKRRFQYRTPTNYYSSTYWTANSDIEAATGDIITNNYRNVVTIDNVSEGESYMFLEKRVLSSSYNNEKYAFYDANDQLVGDVHYFYYPNDPVYIDPPIVGNIGRWFIVVPAGVTKIKIAVLTGNSKQQVIKTDLYFPPEP